MTTAKAPARARTVKLPEAADPARKFDHAQPPRRGAADDELADGLDEMTTGLGDQAIATDCLVAIQAIGLPEAYRRLLMAPAAPSPALDDVMAGVVAPVVDDPVAVTAIRQAIGDLCEAEGRQWQANEAAKVGGASVSPRWSELASDLAVQAETALTNAILAYHADPEVTSIGPWLRRQHLPPCGVLMGDLAYLVIDTEAQPDAKSIGPDHPGDSAPMALYVVPLANLAMMPEGGRQ